MARSLTSVNEYLVIGFLNDGLQNSDLRIPGRISLLQYRLLVLSVHDQNDFHNISNHYFSNINSKKPFLILLQPIL